MKTAAREPHEPRRSRLRTAPLVVGSLILAALLLAFLPPLIPTERLRLLAISAGEEALERPVSIGDLRIRLLPMPTLEARNIQIGTNEEEIVDSLLELDWLRVRISPLPLFFRRIEVTRVLLIGGRLRLERLLDGSLAAANILDLAEPIPNSTWQAEFHTLAFRQVHIELVDSYIVPGETVVTEARIVRGRIAPRRALEGGTSSRSKAPASPLVSRAAPNLVPSLPREHNPFYVDLELAMFDRSPNILVRGVAPRPTRHSTNEEDSDFRSHPRPVELRVLVTELETAPLEPYLESIAPLVPETLSLDLIVAGDLGATVELEGTLQLSLELIADISGMIDTGKKPPAVEIEANVDIPDIELLARLVPFMEQRLPRPADLQGRAKLRGRVTGTLDDLVIDGFAQSDHLRIIAGSLRGGSQDDSGLLIEARDLALNLKAHSPDDLPLRLHLDIGASHSILDYQTSEVPPDAPPQLPSATISAAFEIDHGKLRFLDFEKLEGALYIEGGSMTLEPRLLAHQGSVRARIDSDLDRVPSTHRLELLVANMSTGSLLGDLMPDVPPPVTGTLNLNMQVDWRGQGFRAFVATADGEGRVTLRGGQITTLDLEPDITEIIREIAVTIGVLPPEDVAEPTLRDVDGDFIISEGAAVTEIMEIRGDFTRIFVRGGVGLDQSLRISGSFAFSPEVADLIGPMGQLLRGPDGWLAVPFSIYGTVAEPDVSIDAAALIERAVRGLVGPPDTRWEELRRLWLDRVGAAEPDAPAG